MEKWFINFVFYLLPHWQLYSTPWMRLWQESERRKYVNIIRFSLTIFILTYVAHHYFVDQPLGLANDPKWTHYRFGLATAGLVCFSLTFKVGSSINPFWYKAPVALLGISSGYLQTLSMTWYPEVPYLWGIIIPVIFAVILKISTLNSLLYTAFIYGLQYNHYREVSIDQPLIIGAFFTGLVFVAITKRSMTAEVQSFLEHQEKIAVEKKLVDSKKEMIEQVQGFLPRIINERIMYNIDSNKMSVLQAVDEELRPKEKMISCLYSDIRRYTQLSKDENFVRQSVLPDSHEAIAIVEEFNGIPRTIGDLVFSYFDQPKTDLNVIFALLAAHEINAAVELRNKNQEDAALHIRRYLILTMGSALVGNIGGSGSAREITALGPCVNKAARLDELTKNKNVAEQIGTNGVLMDRDAYFIAADVLEGFDITKIDLNKHKLKIRDFEEDDAVWFVPLSMTLKGHIERELFKRSNNEKARRAA